MKKKNTLLRLIMCCLLVSIATNSFSNVEEPPANRWNTVICTITYPDGHETHTSACSEPAKNGPCDRYVKCVFILN